MSDDYLIGVDIGTQGTKTILFSVAGEPAASAFEPSRHIKPLKGAVEQEPDDIYHSVTRTIAEVMEKSRIRPAQVLGIGIDGQMAGIMGIDRNWNAVTPYDSWLDTRCEKYIEKIKQEAEEKVIRITGCPVTYAHGPKVLWWKYERPEIYKKINKFILPTTYVTGRLAGLEAENAYIDYTHLHFSGFGDVEKGAWSEELLRIFEVDGSKMPEIVEPWRVVGKLTERSAAECGLISGIPLVAGCGDQTATSLGAGITRKGMIFDVAGTASVFSCCVDRYNPDVKNKTLLFPRSVIPGLWIPMAYINGGGLCLKWFKDNLTGSEDFPGYAKLDSEAESIPAGSEGLLFLPHFSGRVCPNNPDVRGSWLGLSWVHTRAHMYRAIMEGIAYEYSYYLKVIRELLQGSEFEQVYAIGGGAKSTLFNSIKADALGINYNTLQTGDTAPLGSAIVAGFGVGAYKDIAAAADERVELGRQILFDGEKNQEYKKSAEIYEKVFEALAPTFRSLAV